MKRALALTTLLALFGSGVALAGTTDAASCTTACNCTAKTTDAKSPVSSQNKAIEEDIFALQRP